MNNFCAQIGRDKIWEGNEVKLPEILIFDTHINVCTKTN